MRTRIVLVVLLVMAWVATPSALMGQKKALTLPMSLRQRIDTELFNLDRNLARAPQMRDRYRALEKSEREIRRLRQTNARQTAEDEIYLDQLTIAFRDLPSEAQFHMDECDGYRIRLIAHLQPMAGVGSTGEALRQALKWVDHLCTK